MTQLATPASCSRLNGQADKPQASHRRLLKEAVAALSDEAIHSMSPRELIFAVRAAGALSLPQGDGRDLHHADRATLERMAFLSRRACRHGNRERPHVASAPVRPR